MRVKKISSQHLKHSYCFPEKDNSFKFVFLVYLFFILFIFIYLFIYLSFKIGFDISRQLIRR